MIKLNEKSAGIGLVVGCILFGLGSVIVAFLSVGAYAIAFWRLAVAAVIFWLLTYFSGQLFPRAKLARRYTAISGFFLAFDLALWHESIYAVGPGISTLLNSLQVFWLSAIGFFWFKERQTKLQIFSLFLAVTGVAMIGSPEFSHNGNALWGFISGIVSGACLALSMVYVRKTHEVERTAIYPLMLILSLSGMAALFLPSMIFDSTRFFPKNGTEIGLILIYGAVMQCFAWGLIAYVIPMLSLSLTGLLLLSEPIAALIIDTVFLHKPIGLIQWCGAFCTLVAIYLGTLKK